MKADIRDCESLGFAYNELEAINALPMDELFYSEPHSCTVFTG